MAEGRAQRVSQHAGRPHGSGDRWSHLYLGGHLVSMIKPTRGVLSQVHSTGTILSLNIHSCSPTLGARNCAERCPVPKGNHSEDSPEVSINIPASSPFN